MIIESKNIAIKLSDAEDEELAQLTSSSPDLVNMSEVRTYPGEMPTEMFFRIEKDGELVGEINLSRIRWYNRKCEISVLIKKEWQGKGLGKEAMKSLIDFAFNRMNLHRLEAEVIEFNKPSLKLMKTLGFKKEGTLREAKYFNGKYWNILRFGLLKSEWENLNEEKA